MHLKVSSAKWHLLCHGLNVLTNPNSLVFHQEELSILVLEAYIRSLIEDQRKDLIATFVAKLPPNMQVDWYARFLEGEWLKIGGLSWQGE